MPRSLFTLIILQRNIYNSTIWIIYDTNFQNTKHLMHAISIEACSLYYMAFLSDKLAL